MIFNSLNSLWLVVVLLIVTSSFTTAQSFLRQGFVEGEDHELDISERISGLSSQLTLASRVAWELPPLQTSDIRNRVLRRHVRKYLGKNPVQLSLLAQNARKGSFRAIGSLPNGKKLRVLWGEGLNPPTESLDTSSYDDALYSRLTLLELEVVLPPLPRTKVLPSIVYKFPLAVGSVNPQTVVPRGAARVSFFPEGRKEGAKYLDLGKSYVVPSPMRNGLVDPSWAKGRAPVFRRGRKSGLM